MPEAPVLSHRWRLPSTNCHLPARHRDCSLTHVLVPLVLRGRKPKATTSIGLNLREAILGLCRSVAHHGASQCLTEHGMLTASQKNKSVACGSHSKGSSSAGCCKDRDVCKSLQSAGVAVLQAKQSTQAPGRSVPSWISTENGPPENQVLRHCVGVEACGHLSAECWWLYSGKLEFSFSKGRGRM